LNSEYKQKKEKCMSATEPRRQSLTVFVKGKKWTLRERPGHAWSKELQSRTLGGTQTDLDKVLGFTHMREPSGPT